MRTVFAAVHEAGLLTSSADSGPGVGFLVRDGLGWGLRLDLCLDFCLIGLGSGEFGKLGGLVFLLESSFQFRGWHLGLLLEGVGEAASGRGSADDWQATHLC